MPPIPAPSRRPLPPLDPLLTDREAAACLAMSVPTFWRRVADGTIPRPLKFGGLSRWPHSDILAVIEVARSCREGRNHG